MNLNTEICNAFNAHAAEYEQAALIQKEIGMRLFERLDYLKIQPRYVLDLGCGAGLFSKQLKKRYPKALIVGLDRAALMLEQARLKQSWLTQWPLVEADMSRLPFDAGLFDLVFANQSLHWADSMPGVMREINRVMARDGCLMFSTLGPDTFLELRKAWSVADHYAHTNDFLDMHDLGDILLAERFSDPVVDMEKLAIHYQSLSLLLRSVKAQGVRNIHLQRNKGLTGRRSWRAFNEAMEQFRTEKGLYPLSYEVIYGHAWKGAVHCESSGTETFIPVSQLRRTQNAG